MRSQPLTIYQGDDYTAYANVTSVDGTAVDLTGFTAPSAQLRRSSADTDSTVDATFTCAIVLPSTVSLNLARAVTVALSGSYVWDLQVVDPTGHLTTVGYGPARVLSEVTRP